MADAYKGTDSEPTFSLGDSAPRMGILPVAYNQGNFNKHGALRGSMVTDFIGRALWTYTARLRQLVAQQVAIKS